MYSGRLVKNVETSNTTTRLDLLTYYLAMKEVICRVSNNTTICIVDLTRKHKGKYSRETSAFYIFITFLMKMPNNKANTSLTVCEKYYFIENVIISR
jgi:hypothetical protein